ncbi:MAG: ATP synthase F1 subunit delta [Acidobacteriaceae bacterium]
MAIVAARYARAVADVVESGHLAKDEIDRQLADISRTLGESPELRGALVNESIPVDERVGVIDALSPKLGLAREVRNFLAVLLRHDRMGSFDEIVEEYHAEMDRRQGMAEAEVVSARRLDASERTDLEQQIATLAGTRVRASFHEDGELLGGVLVRIGSTVYDGSIRGRLGRLREELISR